MVQESLLYHSMVIKILLGFLAINLFIPLFFKQNSISAIKAVRISSFIYSALIAMAIFTGMILYMLGQVPWSLEMSLMVVASIALATIETMRIKKLKKLWMSEKSMTNLSWRYVATEIAIVAATVAMMIVGA
ncbi:hypothetical protein MNB_SV-6-1759 [hydrothermal vent metagenome]|uniref:Uncharacterized protein n=1 Tax=hydrothermal vent metagenome TaxID=652676 RepID=A0A1W1BYQ0_9ZZZZ